MKDVNEPKVHNEWPELYYRPFHFWVEPQLYNMSVKPKRFPGAEPGEEKMSLVSKFTRILIAINFLPVTLNSEKNKANFSFFSLKTMIYLFFSYSPL